MDKKLKLSIIISVYNEERTISEIIRRVRAAPLEDIEKEIIVVDDGSTDRTAGILRNFKGSDIIILRHEKNLGKGAAIKTALSKVSGEAIIIQDGDLEYDPKDIEKMLKPYLEGKGNVVYGSRFTGERRNMFFWHLLGNKLLSLLTNILYNTTLSDMETGYKLFDARILKSIPLKVKGFGFEPEVTAKVLRRGHYIYEVPISYMGRSYSEGKKITWREGFRSIYYLFRFLFFN